MSKANKKKKQKLKGIGKELGVDKRRAIEKKWGDIVELRILIFKKAKALNKLVDKYNAVGAEYNKIVEDESDIC